MRQCPSGAARPAPSFWRRRRRRALDEVLLRGVGQRRAAQVAPPPGLLRELRRRARAAGGLLRASLLPNANLLELRARDRGRLRLLSSLRRRARRGGDQARAAEDRNRPLLRRDRLDLARRVGRPGGPPRAARPLLRADEGDRRAPRRDGGEVHRRCGDGGVRRAGGARGRRAARRPRGGRRCATRCRSSACRRGSAS